jgi:Fe-S-cluster containining protein
MTLEPDNKPDQFGFVCTQCGECCKNLSDKHNVLLNAVDIERIANFLGMEISAFKEMYLVKLQSLKMKSYDLYRFSAEGSCKFLSGDNRCSIHEVKPFQCANSPFGFFWTGRGGYACTNDVSVPADHTSVKNDRHFLSQSEKRTV